jgi:hypothetical protein
MSNHMRKYRLSEKGAFYRKEDTSSLTGPKIIVDIITLLVNKSKTQHLVAVTNTVKRSITRKIITQISIVSAAIFFIN